MNLKPESFHCLRLIIVTVAFFLFIPNLTHSQSFNFLLSAGGIKNFVQDPSNSFFFNTATIQRLSGTPQEITFSLTSLPTWARLGGFSPPSCTPNPDTCFTTFMVETDTTSLVPPGNYPFTVTATAANGSSQEATFQLRLKAPLTSGSFLLQGPEELFILPGVTIENTINVTNFITTTDTEVSFSIEGLPQGITRSFSPQRCTGACSTVLTLSASHSVTPGHYQLFVKGTGLNGKTDNFPILLTITSPPRGPRTTYYVSLNGNDELNPGTFAAPFRSIRKGWSMAKPGDSVLVMPGTYEGEELVDYMPNFLPGGLPSVNRDLDVKIKAYDPNNRPVLGPNSQGRIELWGSRMAYITLDGLILDGRFTPSPWGQPNPPNASSLGFMLSADRSVCDPNSGNSPHHILFQNSEIRNQPGNGIMLGPSASHNIFRNVSVHHSFPSATYSAGSVSHYINGDDNIVEFSEIYKVPAGPNFWRANSDDCLQYHADRNIARYNRIHDLGYHYGYNLTPVAAPNARDSRIYGNVIWNIGEGGTFVAPDSGDGAGIWAAYDSFNNEIYNNTIFNVSGPGIWWGSSSDTDLARGGVIKNNLIFNVGFGGNYQDIQLDVKDAASVVVSHNFCRGSGCSVSGDPLFVDLTSFNFRLRPGSPAINAGVDLGPEFAKDFDGVSRPQGAGWDIGAYEFGGTPQPPPPAPPPTPKLAPQSIIPTPQPSPLIEPDEPEAKTLSTPMIFGIVILILIILIFLFVRRQRV